MEDIKDEIIYFDPGSNQESCVINLDDELNLIIHFITSEEDVFKVIEAREITAIYQFKPMKANEYRLKKSFGGLIYKPEDIEPKGTVMEIKEIIENIDPSVATGNRLINNLINLSINPN